MTLLFACVCYYFASGEWISFFLLVSIAVLPFLSLAVSLPAMIQFRIRPAGPDNLEQGQPGEAMLLGACPLPMPPFRGKLRLTYYATGESERYQPDLGIPTDHCGGLELSVEKARVYDYLGLIFLPVSCKERKKVYISPLPLPLVDIPDLTPAVACTWKPKPGGGFSETHELRDYHPGDSLNQVHWKLSAKTGKLMLREAMEPVRGTVLLKLTLRGTPEELDRLLGRLLWLGQTLLQLNTPFEIRCLTGSGIPAFQVKNFRQLHKALEDLLSSPVAPEGSIDDYAFQASWAYTLGGEPDEN